jgi:hypothetical protein
MAVGAVKVDGQLGGEVAHIFWMNVRHVLVLCRLRCHGVVVLADGKMWVVGCGVPPAMYCSW